MMLFFLRIKIAHAKVLHKQKMANIGKGNFYPAQID
jgi:hypothetical protein